MTSSEEPIIGELALVTDGDKEHDEAAYIELAPQLQWVHVDLSVAKRVSIAM